MILTTQKLLAVAALALMAGPARADSPSQRGYHLFKPVPKDQMRPLSADRPDATESTQTVDAGHVQLEIDIALYLRDRARFTEDTFVFGATNLKFGITHNIDLQLIWSPYVRAKTRATDFTEKEEGFSNLVVRTKFNLWGNDGDSTTSMALLPFVIVPLGSESVGSDNVQGGIVIPFAMDLPQSWGLGAQVGFDVVRNDADDGHRLDFTQTVVLGRDIVGRLAGFVEFLSVVPAEGDWFGTVNIGLTYAVNDNVQLDVASFIGVNSAAPDFAVFTGLTWRF
ncbi:MAG: transporter [Planctomycetota bacterium]